MSKAVGQPAETTPAIDAVVFDFGNVVCSFSLEWLVQGLAERSGVCPDRIADGLRASTPHVVEYESGQISSEEFYRRVCRKTGLTLGVDEFRAAYCGIFKPIPEVWQLLRSLKGRYLLGLLSNTNEWHDACAIQPAGVFPLFDAVTLSYRVGVMKPSEMIYRDMLTKLARPPCRCVYIDDLQENVDAAGALGMFALRFRTAAELLGDLAGLGVTWPPFPNPRQIGV
jgi:putative hydrolase of the HAD superfamily